MQIGSMEVDEGVVAGMAAVAISALLLVFGLRGQRSKPAETSVQRAVRLAREAGLQPGESRFVDSKNKVYQLRDLTAQQRTDHYPGHLVVWKPSMRRGKGMIWFTFVHANQDPVTVPTGSFQQFGKA